MLILNPIIQKAFLTLKPSTSRKKNQNVFRSVIRKYTSPAGTPGAGAGKGGGAGGTIRESGGGLGQFGAAQEEGYFYQQQRQLLEQLKKRLKQATEDLPKKEEK